MKVYHGSHREISEIETNQGMYFTPFINTAKEYALGLNDLGEYNKSSYIYSIDINESLVVNINDFMYFDGMGYTDYNSMSEINYNKESDYYCVKGISKLTLEESYNNEL